MRLTWVVAVVVGLVGCAEETATLEEARVQVPCKEDPTQQCALACNEGEPLGRSCKVIDNISPDYGAWLYWNNRVCPAHRAFSYGGLAGCCDTQWYRCE